MISVIILRTHKDEEIPTFAWNELSSFTNITSINMLGFSKREVKCVSKSDRMISFEVQKSLVDEFLLALNEASSIDFTYTRS